MKIEKISLLGFRNYEHEIIEFSDGINVISGDNAQGKTNLLESIYLLSCGRSFRTRFDRELIKFDELSAEILADISSNSRDSTVKIRMAQGQKKQILINGVKKTASDLSNYFACVLFSPSDLSLIKDGAVERRKFLDTAISQLRPQYAEYLRDYNRALEQKMAILRDCREKPSLLLTIDDFSEQMCRLSAKIIRYRATYVENLSIEARKIQADFSANADDLLLKYSTVSSVKDVFSSEREIYYDICEHLEAHKDAEIASASALTGVHKDDLEVSINGKPARAFASQGQTRTATLSLKLAEREMFLSERGEYPVLLLDDVLSELDSKRQDFVLNRIGEGQTIITCCDGEEIREKTGGKVIMVSGGRLNT